MPSSRRLRLLGLAVVLFVLVTLYVTAGARQTRNSAFYGKTSDALGAARAAKEAVLREPTDADVGKRLRDAEDAAKRAADKKAEDFHGEEGKKRVEEMGEKSVAGRKIMKEVPEEVPETKEKQRAKDELNDILKRSPIIIFSKTYCPFSKKAKAILLEKYNITPKPYVVELDTHPLGPYLQEHLAESTGRRTVPNVLINGKSIGGGDDVEALHVDGKLADTVRSMGGKRM
ncbi:glutaredoxin, partial [Trichodelitschia bisporula]